MPGECPSDRVLQDLLRSLQSDGHLASTDGSQVVADPGRLERKGIPEIVFALYKSIDQVISAVSLLLERNDPVIVSRVSLDDVQALSERLTDFEIEHHSGSWSAVVARPGVARAQTGGRVAIFAAGTSDWPAAHEARVVAEEMGCNVDLVVDVGVAGLHRLFGPLRAVLDEGVDAIIVAAGMDGALPSVIAGTRARAGDRSPNLGGLRTRRSRASGADEHAAERRPGPHRREHRQCGRCRIDSGSDSERGRASTWGT